VLVIILMHTLAKVISDVVISCNIKFIMVRIGFSVCLIFIGLVLSNSVSSQTPILTSQITSSAWTYSNKTLLKTPEMLTVLADCSEQEFVSVMKTLGIKLAFDAKLCQAGQEQASEAAMFKDGGLYSAGLLSFSKCDGTTYSSVSWYGSDEYSGLKVFLDKLTFDSTDEDGYRIYRYVYRNQGYLFAFKRSVQWVESQNFSLATERLFVWNATK